MKSPNRKLLFLALLALATAPLTSSAEDYEVQGDAIVPENAQSALATEDSPALEEEVVIVKRKPQTKRKKVIIQEVDEPAAVEQASASSDEAEVLAASTSGQRVGSTLDKTIDSKMNNVRSEIENQLVKAIEGIQISVGNANTPTQQVSDQVVNTAAAPAVMAAPQADNKAYMTVDQAPSSGGESTAELKNSDEPLQGSVGIFPLGGITTMNRTGNGYDRESEFTVGAGLEVDASDNISFVTTYRYSRYNIRITTQNSMYTAYPILYPSYGYTGTNNELNKLEYNQNVIDAGMRLYLLPKTQRFRFFVGGGAGYQKGYLNYTSRAIEQLKATPGNAQSGMLDDVEITQFLFNVETGAEFQLSKVLSIGGDFKYSSVLSSSVSDPTNQGWFNNSGYTSYVQQTDKALVGNSLKDTSFYSILGTIKYRF